MKQLIILLCLFSILMTPRDLIAQPTPITLSKPAPASQGTESLQRDESPVALIGQEGVIYLYTDSNLYDGARMYTARFNRVFVRSTDNLLVTHIDADISDFWGSKRNILLKASEIDSFSTRSGIIYTNRKKTDTLISTGELRERMALQAKKDAELAAKLASIREILASIEEKKRRTELERARLVREEKEAVEREAQKQIAMEQRRREEEESRAHLVSGGGGKQMPAPGYGWVAEVENDLRVRWSPGIQHPKFPHVIASANSENWEAAPGYALVKNEPDDIRTRWVTGAEHPKVAHVVATPEEGHWMAAPGYAWAVGGDRSDLQVRWTRGMRHPTAPNVSAGWYAGSWIPDPGYVRMNAVDMADLRVRWSPGKAHPRSPHVVASSIKGVWDPGPGYRFATNNPGDHTVVLDAPQLPKTESYFEVKPGLSSRATTTRSSPLREANRRSSPDVASLPTPPETSNNSSSTGSSWSGFLKAMDKAGPWIVGGGLALGAAAFFGGGGAGGSSSSMAPPLDPRYSSESERQFLARKQARDR